MPNKHTFLIPPIGDLVKKYVGDGKGWIDPFAGENSPAEITNDLNPKAPTKFHVDALEFLKGLKGTYKGCIYDPPYSPRQIKECYEGIGLKMTQADAQLSHSWSVNKNIIMNLIVPGGLFFYCGWNSCGMGHNRGFEIIEILLVAHGPGHSDTIITVERRVNKDITSFGGE